MKNKAVDDLEFAVMRMQRIIDSANAMNRGANYKPTREHCILLYDIFKPVIQSLAPILRKNKFSSSNINCSDLAHFPPLFIDRQCFTTVAFNLLINAIQCAKSHKTGFRVEIHGKVQGKTLQISICDWGTMPKTAIYKHRKLKFWKNEIWFAEDFSVPAPADDFVLTE